MSVTREQLLAANELSNFILNEYEELQAYDQEITFSESKISEILDDGEPADVFFEFPYCEEGKQMTLEEYLYFSDEIKSIEVINEGNIVKTKLNRYYVVHGSEYEEHAISDFNLKTNYDNISINLDTESFIIALVNTKLGNYSKLGIDPMRSFPVVIITYEKEEDILNEEEETTIIAAYLFEIADSINIALFLAEEYGFDNEIEEAEVNTIRQVERYNEGMDLFVSATQTTDKELKFLNFYKILEYFAPVAINIEANEIMRKKLDAPRNKFEDGTFIKSIFDLAISTSNKRARDENLISAAFEYCFDFVGLFELLPNSLQKKSLRKLKKLDYSTESNELSTARNIVSRVVYKTRNKVVHAKSNFKSTGEEVDFDELDELNEFMKAACSQAIRWYNRLPSHLKTIED